MSLTATYPARPASVGAARNATTAFARQHGASEAILAAVSLAVSEAATNVVVHAYRDHSEPGEIELSATCAGGELCVIVADTGGGLQPRNDSPGLGLGLGLIARVADGLDLLQRASGGLELQMRFALDAAPGASAP